MSVGTRSAVPVCADVEWARPGFEHCAPQKDTAEDEPAAIGSIRAVRSAAPRLIVRRGRTRMVDPLVILSDE